MRNLIVSLALMLMLAFGSVAHAGGLTTDTVNVEGLSEIAQAEVALKAAELRKAALKKQIIPDVAEVQKYVSVGEQIGKALAVTAKELGIEVNNFASTPVGMIAIFLIVWHFFGNMVVHLMFGAAWFMTLIPVWIYFFKRLVMGRKEIYNDAGKRTSVEYNVDASGDTVGTFIITGAVIFAVGVFGIFTY